MAEEKTIRWYPTHLQLKDPQSIERAFREVLRMFYGMEDRVNEMHGKVNSSPAPTTPPATKTNTASITNILGLPIFPADTTQLADGTKLTWVATKRRFEFLP